ncbi:hypothetical protein ACMXHS_001475 [Campylobacter jejuni]
MPLAIENYNGSIFTKVALQISPYLFLRSANIRNLEWSEIDFKNLKIIIPANKMKKRGGGEFFENKENREKLIKTLIIHLNSYLKTKNNPERINILVEIYQELQKGSQTPDLIDIEELEFNKEDIFEELFYALGGLGGMYSVEMIQSRIANFIKILGGEPKLLLERFTA